MPVFTRIDVPVGLEARLRKDVEDVLYDVDEVVYGAVKNLEEANKRMTKMLNWARDNDFITEDTYDEITKAWRQYVKELIKYLKNFREEQFLNLEDVVYDNLLKK
jgi:hypothetical protein